MESLTKDGFWTFSDIIYFINWRRHNLKLMNMIKHNTVILLTYFIASLINSYLFRDPGS